MSRGYSYKEVGDRMHLNPDNIRKRVFYYCSVSAKMPGKLVEKFGDTFLTEILYYPNHDITEIEVKINKELIKYLGLKDIQANIDLPIPHKRGTTELTGGEFDEFVTFIKPYILIQKKLISESITNEQAAYFWYLINNQYCLKGIDAERFNKLVEITETE